MAGEKQSLKDLKACMKAATNAADRAACEATFKTAEPTGSATGGKVFSTSDGNAVFVSTGDKVFGGKVF